MALESYAICTTEEVWDALSPAEDDKNKYEHLMEPWVNGASLQLEQLLNRPIKARRFDVYQGGSGRKTLLTDFYPIIRLHSLQIQTFDLLSTYNISVDRADAELVVDKSSGRLTLLPSAPVSTFFSGDENIHLVYEAGFTDGQLSAFKQAVVELIAVYWTEMGKDPRAQQTNESIGSSFFSGRFDPKRLSHQTQMAIFSFQRLEV